MKHVKLFEVFLNESKIDKAVDLIDNLPTGKIFDDSKNIENVFKRSKHTWSEVIETFEKNQDNSKEATISIKDIQITQPNIQAGKVKRMLNNVKDLPLINAVKFKDGYAIYDGHHRLMTAWALGETKIKVNLIEA